MLVYIIFKTNFKIIPFYVHGRCLLCTLYLDRVASEAVVVLVGRTSHSIEFCGSFAFCLSHCLPPSGTHTHICLCIGICIHRNTANRIMHFIKYSFIQITGQKHAALDIISETEFFLLFHFLEIL